MNEKRYKIKWKFTEPEFSEVGFTKEEVKADPMNAACDAFIYISILRDEAGTSTLITGRDGDRGGADIEDIEIFKAWLLMARELSNSKTLSPDKKFFCQTVFETIANALRSIREKKESNVN